MRSQSTGAERKGTSVFLLPPQNFFICSRPLALSSPLKLSYQALSSFSNFRLPPSQVSSLMSVFFYHQAIDCLILVCFLFLEPPHCITTCPSLPCSAYLHHPPTPSCVSHPVSQTVLDSLVILNLSSNATSFFAPCASKVCFPFSTVSPGFLPVLFPFPTTRNRTTRRPVKPNNNLVFPC